MKIKVCGMTETQNTIELSKIAPDFIGFNFYKGSKRYVTQFPTIDSIALSIAKVGVFVNETKEVVVATMIKFDLEIAQLHGGETKEYCEDLKKSFQQDMKTISKKIIKVFMVGTTFDFNECNKYEGVCDYFLFDTKGADFGGNGKKFNWQLLEAYQGNTPYLLAGGITIDDLLELKILTTNSNIKKCIGVDINSGFETKPGIKNIELIQSFKNQLA